VRDLLHPDDLLRAIELQLAGIDRFSGQTFNLGGGLEISTSLAELTARCQKLTGNQVAIASDPTTSPVDSLWYVSDCARAEQAFGWKPQKGVDAIFSDIHQWLVREKVRLAPLFEGKP
jgi:CDP-paratose 2-epimerase